MPRKRLGDLIWAHAITNAALCVYVLYTHNGSFGFNIEVVRQDLDASHTRVVLFDFDGTLSLVRSGWMDVMVPMMVEILAGLKSGETEEELRAVVEDFVWRLTGKETVYQMIELAGRVRQRGGEPLDPLEYKRMYLDLLWTRIQDRVAAFAPARRVRTTTWCRDARAARIVARAGDEDVPRERHR